MRAGKIIAYIVAAILIFFGVLFIWSAFSPGGKAGNIIAGIISAGIGLVLIFWAGRRAAQAPTQNVTLNVDLPGNVGMDTLKCQSCGGTLAPKDISMVAGAPVVTCPWCGTTYQLTEEPKW